MVRTSTLGKAQGARLKRELLFEGFYWLSSWDRMLRRTVLYGYRPFQAFLWLLAFFIVGTFIFGTADGEGAMKPNDSGIWLWG